MEVGSDVGGKLAHRFRHCISEPDRKACNRLTDPVGGLSSQLWATSRVRRRTSSQIQMLYVQANLEQTTNRNRRRTDSQRDQLVDFGQEADEFEVQACSFCWRNVVGTKQRTVEARESAH